MKKYMTWSREIGFHFRTREKTTTFLKYSGRNAVARITNPDASGDYADVMVYDTELKQAMRQAVYDGIYKTTPGYTPPPPPVAIKWENSFAIPSGSTDYLVENRNFVGDDPLKTLFSIPGSRRVIFMNCRFKSRGLMFGGGDARLRVYNSITEILPQTRIGRWPERTVNLGRVKEFIWENNTMPAPGTGLYITGSYPNDNPPYQYVGDPASGDRISIRFNKAKNVDGRWTDAVVNGVVQYRRSNIGPNQWNDPRVKADPSSKQGFEMAQFIQFNNMPRFPGYVGWNEVLSELGVSRMEDGISYHGGSGGSPTLSNIVEYNLVQNSGGYDWNYVKGKSTTYDGGNNITLNADGFQIPTSYSGTCILVGDNKRSAYEDNTSYVNIRGNVGLGFRAVISQQSGHHVRFEGNDLYETDRHDSGVMYTGNSFHGYQVTNYGGDALASNGQRIWGYNEFYDNVDHPKSYTGPDTTLTPPSDILQNGGSAGGNIKRARVDDGGASAIAAWRQRAVDAGLRIGSNLTYA